jgi:uncharacterized protein involved in exopolysaccharide biosynthesis
MPVILASIALAAVLAIIAGLGLYSMQKPVYQSQRMPSVRVGDPGHNLVGPNWSGNPSEPPEVKAAINTTSRKSG